MANGQNIITQVDCKRAVSKEILKEKEYKENYKEQPKGMLRDYSEVFKENIKTADFIKSEDVETQHKLESDLKLEINKEINFEVNEIKKDSNTEINETQQPVNSYIVNNYCKYF